jgi:hypothetical protein
MNHQRADAQTAALEELSEEHWDQVAGGSHRPNPPDPIKTTTITNHGEDDINKLAGANGHGNNTLHHTGAS